MPQALPEAPAPQPLLRPNLVLACLGLVLATFAVYFPVAGHQFINFDVDTYLVGNRHVNTGLSLENARWAFSSFLAGNWHPLTWLSHMLDVELFGLNPAGHNLSNVAFHSAAAVLLLILLVRLTGALGRSFVVAALFALHPMHVESVAWIAERKDVLSAFFWFLTLIAYTGYRARGGRLRYLATLAFFILGLTCKPMLVTLPVVLLLIDVWPLKRLAPVGAQRLAERLWPLVREKLPFFALSLVSSVVTVLAQQQAGAVASVGRVSFPLRLENALVSYLNYLRLTLVPHDLALVYPLPPSVPLWQALGALVALAAITAAVVRYRRVRPYLLVGWFWFLISLVPVIGLVQVGSQAMADRYSYLPSVGLFIMAAWGIGDLARHLAWRREFTAALAASAILAAAGLTWHQVGFWRDNITLYRHTLEVTKDNWLVHANLGLTLALQGDLQSALSQYRESLRINPGSPQSQAGLGLVLDRLGDSAGAIAAYREALRLQPDFKEAHNNLGLALSHQGDLDGAVAQYRQALSYAPDYLDALNNLGIALARKGLLSQAIEKFEEVLRLRPDDPKAQGNLSRARSLAGGQGGAAP